LSHYQAHNPGGGVVQLHVAENIEFVLRPSSYILLFDPISPYIPLPRGYNFLLVIMVAWSVLSQWPSRPLYLKRLLVWVGGLNIALMFLFGQKDEIRDYNLVFPVLFLSACWLTQQHSCLRNPPQAGVPSHPNANQLP